MKKTYQSLFHINEKTNIKPRKAIAYDEFSF
jgi:hypothetical protein